MCSQKGKIKNEDISISCGVVDRACKTEVVLVGTCNKKR